MDFRHTSKEIQTYQRDLECAWAAGFFDGEGSTSFFSKSNHHICVSISQVNKETLNRFYSVVETGTMVLGEGVKHTNSRPIWTLRTYGKDNVVKFLNPIWPYLSKEKRDQALKALHGYVFRVLKKPPNHLRKGWKFGQQGEPKTAFEYGVGCREYSPT
jgi:hypothetical protein